MQYILPIMSSFGQQICLLSPTNKISDFQEYILLNNMDISLASFSYGLLHFISSNNMLQTDDANLIFNICILLYHLCNEYEKKRIAIVISVINNHDNVLYFIIDFNQIVGIINEHSYNIYQVEKSFESPFSMECTSPSKYPVHWNNTVYYTFNINGKPHDQDYCSIIFLSNIDTGNILLDIYLQ
jgi:hypothetical protein